MASMCAWGKVNRWELGIIRIEVVAGSLVAAGKDGRHIHGNVAVFGQQGNAYTRPTVS